MALMRIPGSASSRAGVAATMTESPTAVISLPDTCASGVSLAEGDGELDGDLVASGRPVPAVPPGPAELVRPPPVAPGPSAACFVPLIAAACPPPAEPAEPVGPAAQANRLAPAKTHSTRAPTMPPPRSTAASLERALRARRCFAMNKLILRGSWGLPIQTQAFGCPPYRA